MTEKYKGVLIITQNKEKVDKTKLFDNTIEALVTRAYNYKVDEYADSKDIRSVLQILEYNKSIEGYQYLCRETI